MCKNSKKVRRGTQTVVSHLSYRLLQRWVPKWHEAFSDHDSGLFFERVNPNFKPLRTGVRRLLTQCRLLAIFSDASAYAVCPVTARDLVKNFETLTATYYIPGAGWIYSADDEGYPLNKTYDLYTQAFVIFALSHFYRATGDTRARKLAGETLAFIDSRLRMPEGLRGFAEALDENLVPVPGPRRHESHMHLLEACLFAAQTWEDPVYTDMGDELASLFENGFYDAGSNILSEYFDDRLVPQPRDGRIVCEPGHYCEWLWLLKKHAARTDAPGRYNPLCRTLLDWANHYGWDAVHGGIFDELDPQGNIIADTKRIWPFTEALKANVLMLDGGADKVALKARIAEMVDVFNRDYMDSRGFWTEWLTRDLKPATDYMPGTTPYHVYFGIMEAAYTLRGRGPSKSWSAWLWQGAYTVQRQGSHLVRALRYGIKDRMKTAA